MSASLRYCQLAYCPLICLSYMLSTDSVSCSQLLLPHSAFLIYLAGHGHTWPLLLLLASFHLHLPLTALFFPCFRIRNACWSAQLTFSYLGHGPTSWLSQRRVLVALEEMRKGLRRDHGHRGLHHRPWSFMIDIWWPDPSRVRREAQEQKLGKDWAHLLKLDIIIDRTLTTNKASGFLLSFFFYVTFTIN